MGKYDALIFLDIDGVLNSTRWLITASKDGTLAIPSREHIDPAAVGVLNQIVKHTRAKVVISSTWRKIHTLEQMRAILKKYDFEGEVIDVTPDFFALRHQRSGKPYVRGDEIHSWLEQNECLGVPFVILDDDQDMGILRRHLIRTTGEDGLLWSHIDAVLKLFTEISQ